MNENQNIEWKRSWRDEYLKWICGFANAQGGVLEIGRNDQGKVVGVKNVLQLLEDIPNKVQALLGIVVEVNLKSEGGAEYLEIVVDPHPNPISYKGEFHYRSGSTRQMLRGAALSRFLLQKYGRTWDDVPMPGVGLKDLDRRTLESFRRRAADSERLSQDILDESDAGVIEKLRLREGEYLKRAAVLLFHPAPGLFVREAYVKIGYFRGPELLYQDVIEGDLFAQVDRAMDLLYSKYTKALISYDGIYRIETFPVPREAMREAVINAVIHRDYASTTPIQIRVYDHRITLWNPGQLPPDWSVEQLTGEHSSRPHNPGIAYSFFRAGMIEAWGRGIRRIAHACETAGNPAPRWEIEPGGGLWLEFPYSIAYRRTADSLAKPASADGSGPKGNGSGESRVEPGNAIETTTQEIKGTTQETGSTTQEIEATTQEIEGITQEDGGTTTQETEATTQEIKRTTQETGSTTQEIEATTQEIGGTTQEDGGTTTQETEATTQEIKRTTQEIKRTTQETGSTTQEIEATTQEIEGTTQEDGGATTQETEATTQEIKRTTQETGSTTQEIEATTQEVGGTTQEDGGTTTQETEATTQEIKRTTQERILALIEAEPGITRRRLAERIGITPDGVKYHLDKLRAAGVIRHVGATKTGRWEVLK